MKKSYFVGITAIQRTVPSIISQKQPVTLIPHMLLELFHPFFEIIPILLSFETSPHHSKEIMKKLDALVLSPGQDIDPSFYNQNQLVTYKESDGMGKRFLRPPSLAPNPKRDEFELSLYHEAKNRQIPILGICRGMQLINIAEEGTLYQEIPETSLHHFLDEDGWIHTHEILLDQSSTFYSFGKTWTITSIHHQAVGKVGKELLATAKSSDGIIEMIEHNSLSIYGVQGHFEKMLDNYPIYKKFLTHFVDEIEKRSSL